MESFPEHCGEGNDSMLSYEKHRDRLTVRLAANWTMSASAPYARNSTR